MIVDTAASDIVYTPKISGVNANFLMPSLENAGIDLKATPEKKEIDFGAELQVDEGSKAKGAWAQIWSAGQGVGSIDDVKDVRDLIGELHQEYATAIQSHQDRSKTYL